MALASLKGLAFFSGLNVTPKNSCLSEYSSQIEHTHTTLLPAVWHPTYLHEYIHKPSISHASPNLVAQIPEPPPLALPRRLTSTQPWLQECPTGSATYPRLDSQCPSLFAQGATSSLRSRTLALTTRSARKSIKLLDGRPPKETVNNPFTKRYM